jgi:adenosylcobyric acid synthase
MNSKKQAKVLMVQGTSSSAGKSLLTAALCRIFARRGVRVAPFKAQNMSNNAGVCADGSEIGRAQIMQATAAMIEPTVDMNPVLLKPEANVRSQVVLMGKPWHTLPAQDYYQRKQILWQTVTGALDNLRAKYDLVIMEGAGSPVELNIKENDIVNMAIAAYAQAPVLLVGDIDRGGIFPQLLGTLWLLSPEEQALIAGFIVNKFRGDINLFTDGIEILEKKGNVPVLGVVPWINDLGIPEEDAVALEAPLAAQSQHKATDIAVIHLPRIANFDDFDPLAAEPGVQVRYVTNPDQLGKPQAVIIPGTKSTMADLAWLRAQGFEEALRGLVEGGTAVIGICGGYQMLGQRIFDPNQIESSQTEAPGLGLLSLETTFAGDKATHRAQATIATDAHWLTDISGQTITGYEIHMGRTTSAFPWLQINQRNGEPVSVNDGCMGKNGRLWGCYLHGLFANDNFRHALLKSLGHQPQIPANQQDPFDHLADVVESNLDMEKLVKLLGNIP